MGGGAFRAQRRGIRELVAGVHISSVVVFKQNQMVAAQCGAERGAHADIHAAVSADHDKRNVPFGVFPAPLPFVKDLHQTA